QTHGFAYTYFPGAVARSEAQAVTVSLGQQRLDLDFRLVASRTARVAGRVQSATGEALGGELVSLVQQVGSGAMAAGSVESARTGPDGVFEIKHVAPGE